MKFVLARTLRSAVMMSAIGALAVSVASAEEVERSVIQVAGDLYRAQNDWHFSVFLVTPEGVIATDPINAEFASWLKDEIDQRFDLPIRYVIYSHDHPDHTSGGEVFAEAGAVVVAHQNAKRVIIGEQRPTAVPEITFTDAMTIELGGKSVELFYFGKSDSDNLIVMHFPEERAVFAVDIISVGRLPSRTFGDAYFPDWIDVIKQVEAMDFDILVPAHGSIGSKADASDHRAYLEELYESVLAAVRADQSLEEMQASITLDKYAEWIQYEQWRESNIEGMYWQVQMHRRSN